MQHGRATSITRAGALAGIAIAVATSGGAGLVRADAADAAQACVESTATCYPSIQQALDAAPPGATVRLAVGQFAGGVVITKDVRLVGAGATASSVIGGGPVIRVDSTKQHRPDVRIESLTISGGTTQQVAGNGDTFNAFGGGLLIPAVHGGGATVHLLHVVVSGNATRPLTTASSPSGAHCPHRDCPYAGSYGGGIANFGDLWIEDSQVVGNSAGGRASDANGGGIFSSGGSLHIRNSVVAGNAAAPLEIGRFAEGGGVHVTDGGLLDVRHSTVTNNRAELVTSWPVLAQGDLIDMNANSGGIHVGDGSSVVVRSVEISHNLARVDDPRGEPLAFDGAMLVGDSRLRMSRSVIVANAVEARTRTSEDVGFSGTSLELDGPATITRTRITGNTAHAVAVRGTAGASSGLAVYDFSDNPRRVVIRHSVIAGNTALAESAHGNAIAQGGGVMNNSLLRLAGVVVRDNTVRAEGRHTLAQGGGIWNGPLLSGPPVELVLRHVAVLRNGASSTSGPRQGGGIYTTVAVDAAGVRLAGNHPAGCYGC